GCRRWRTWPLRGSGGAGRTTGTPPPRRFFGRIRAFAASRASGKGKPPVHRAERPPARGRMARVDTWPVVGMVGGGQLARMTQPAAIALGIRLSVLADSADDSAA